MNSRAVVIARAAIKDLDDASDYLTTHAGDRIARELISEMLATFEKLAEMPGMGHRRRDVENQAYRFWMVKSYVIAYRYDDTTLNVARVLHGNQDFTRIPF